MAQDFKINRSQLSRPEAGRMHEKRACFRTLRLGTHPSARCFVMGSLMKKPTQNGCPYLIMVTGLPRKISDSELEVSQNEGRVPLARVTGPLLFGGTPCAYVLA